MTYAVKNEKLSSWVREAAALCQPDAVYWCDGSKEEYDRLMAQVVKSGKAITIKKRPDSVLFRSDPSDVARVEARTYGADDAIDVWLLCHGFAFGPGTVLADQQSHRRRAVLDGGQPAGPRPSARAAACDDQEKVNWKKIARPACGPAGRDRRLCVRVVNA